MRSSAMTSTDSQANLGELQDWIDRIKTDKKLHKMVKLKNVKSLSNYLSSELRDKLVEKLKRADIN